MDKKIGQLIQERVEHVNMEVTAFAKAIGTERSNAYNIFQRESIDTSLLKKIGQVLNYDFFQDLLEPETTKLMMMKRGVTRKVFVELELTDEEVKYLEIDNRLIER